MMKLEECLYDAFQKYEINEPFRGKIIGMLDTVKNIDAATYEHSLRVGLLSSRIGEFSELDPKPLLYCGLLHDVGKSTLDPTLLKKGDAFTEEDMERVRIHVLNGYFLLKSIFPFTAELMVRHHTYQENPYPAIPESEIKLSRKSRLAISIYSRIVALADFYDALTTRKNKKFVNGSDLPESKLIDIVVKNNPDREGLIRSLSDSGVFKNFYEEIKS
jgi:HD-GYP domain-containing protein (c-di-GMP phosphodiesterase class II)